MTTIIKAQDVNGAKKELEAVFPPELDPRFDFARSESSLRGIQNKRMEFARGLLGGNQWKVQIVSVDNTEEDLDLAADQPRIPISIAANSNWRTS